MEKSPDAFRTISEVADWLGVQAHVLRFWESKFAQVKPVKRAGGRRYYRPSDMRLLGGIKTLLHDEGMTIKGVQKMLREQGVAHVAEHTPAIEDAPSSRHDGKNVLPFDTAGRRGARRRIEVEAEEAQLALEPEETDAQPASGAPKDTPGQPAEPVLEVEELPLAAEPPAPAEEAAENPVAAEAGPSAPDQDDLPGMAPAPTEPHGAPAEPAASEAPPAERPRPRVVDAPDPPDESEIDVEPGTLGRLARLPRDLDPDSLAALADAATRLAALRDRMTGASAG